MIRVRWIAAAALVAAGGAYAQLKTTVSAGAGSTIFPTPILATQRLGDGGGGIIGGNVTINVKITQDVSPRWRIPFSFSVAFLRGAETFFHREAQPSGDTLIRNYLLSNSVNMYNAEIGIEYYKPYKYITPYGGVDFMYTGLSQSELRFTVQQTGQNLIPPQILPAGSRFGALLRAGAEFPFPEKSLWFDASAELGALNLWGRSNVGELFVPTQRAIDVGASRAAEGKTAEDIATFFRLLVKVAWKF